MFIAHAPASFLWTGFLIQRWPTLTRVCPAQFLLGCGLAAGLVPDLDLLYFYFVDHRQHLHHGYLTHITIFWLLLTATWLAVARVVQSRRAIVLGLVVGSNVLLHLALDTVAGKIRWLYPFSRRDFVLAEVPARYDWWVSNFVLHWTFVLELLILIAAAAVWKMTKPGKPKEGVQVDV